MYTAEDTLMQWLKPSGVFVSAGEPVAEIETEKALAEVTAPESGILHHVAEPGAILQVESLLGYILAQGETPPEPATTTTREPVPSRLSTAAPPQQDERFASPNARRVAAELGVDLTGLTGTGPGGRITEADVRAAAKDGT
jgi:pyruvate dehydrogenase E2 component (dihydrolipoyllysine-residue acetyltransferase)